MTEQLKQLREAFERWAPSAFSRRTTIDEDGDLSYDDDWMQGAWVAYVELTASQPAQAGEVDERVAFEAWAKARGYDTGRDAVGGSYSYGDTHQAWFVWKGARASLPTQPAAQTDSMGLPTSCGKPLCSPDEHHPLCKLHKPAAQATPEPSRRFTSDIESPTVQAALSAKFGATPPQQAAGEPVGEPLGYIPTDAIDQIKTPPRLITRNVPVLSYAADGYTAIYTHPAPGVPEVVHAVCNNGDCAWGGPVSECCMLGDIGPLCPECRETVHLCGKAHPAPDVEAAAKKLAECMDYPWEHMPSAGRDNMRKHAEAVLAAAQAKGS